MPTDALFQQALAFHQAGALDQAAAGYRQVLAGRPGDVHALHYLGLIALQQGDCQQAVLLIRQAIAGAPQVPEFHLNLGNALKRAGDVAAAVAAYREALSRRPDFFEGYYNLALLEEQQGALDAAAAALRQACRLRPEALPAWLAAARVAERGGVFGQAVACHETIVRLPGAAAEHWQAYGAFLLRRGTADEAVRIARRALKRFPDAPQLLNLLACAFDELGRLSDAERVLRDALAAQPADPAYLANLAGVLKSQGRVAEALNSYEAALARQPDDAASRSNYLFVLLMSAEHSAGEIDRAHREFAAHLAPPSPDASAALCRLRPPGGRLHIAYLSPDLRMHPVGYFMAGILAQHDRTRFAVTCYATGSHQDALSRRLQGSVDQWVSCAGWTDDALAARVRSDGVDVLVELSGHTADNRLPLLARRLAPVQLSYLGYAHSLRLPWIDGQLSDAVADPPGATMVEDGGLCYRLPNSYYCYTPPDDAPAVVPPPMLVGGYPTFGCFCQLGKVSGPTFDLWAGVLRALPEARLLLRAKGLADPGVRQRITAELLGRGVLPRQLLLEGWQAHREHLAAWGRVDVALDTFPFNLATNTCEALWMGVPTITLSGDRHAARMGSSILRAAGLAGFVANSAEEYIALASSWGRRGDDLAALRGTLRSHLRAMPLLDAVGHARALESAYQYFVDRRRERSADGEGE